VTDHLTFTATSFHIQQYNIQLLCIKWSSVDHIHHHVTSCIPFQWSARSQVLFFQCQSCFVKSVLKMDNTFQEYADMQLILSKAHGCSCMVVSSMSTFKPMHISCHWSSHQGDQCYSLSYDRPWKAQSTNSLCGRMYTEMQRIESPFQCPSKTSCWTCGISSSSSFIYMPQIHYKVTRPRIQTIVQYNNTYKIIWHHLQVISNIHGINLYSKSRIHLIKKLKVLFSLRTT
jgi:hypothetical protein